MTNSAPGAVWSDGLVRGGVAEPVLLVVVDAAAVGAHDLLRVADRLQAAVVALELADRRQHRPVDPEACRRSLVEDEVVGRYVPDRDRRGSVCSRARRPADDAAEEVAGQIDAAGCGPVDGRRAAHKARCGRLRKEGSNAHKHHPGEHGDEIGCDQ